MTRSLRVLVTAVTLLLLMTAVPLVTAATRVEAAPTAWTGSGPGVINFLDGTTSSPQFSYHYNPAPYFTTNTWTFSTVADADGAVTVPYTYVGFHAYFQVRVFLTPFVIHAGSTTYGTPLINDGPAICCTPPSAGFGYSGATDFTVANGDTYGFTFGGSNFDSNATLDGTLTLNLASFRDPATVAANTSWPNASVLTTAGVDGTLTQPGEARWYKVPIVPSSQVQVDLSNLDQNFDLTLFRDIGQAFDTLTSPADLTHLSAEFAGDAYSPSVYSPSVYSPSVYSPVIYSPSVYSPSVYSPSVYSPSVYSPSVYSPSVYSPSVYSPSVYSPSVYSPSVYSPSAAFIDAFSSAQTRSLIGVSARDGSSDESIRSATWNNTGFFYVRVQGRNGASSATPFHLALTNTGGPCSGAALDPKLGFGTIAGVPGTAQTVILTDTTRLGLTGTAATTFIAKLQSIAPVGGVVVDVRTSPRINALNLQADTNAACPFAKNLVAQSIRDVVNSYRDNAGTLKYVVIAGGDAVIPFFRYPDAAGLGPESDYVPPVIDTSPSQASLRLNNVLGQDAYGALTDLTVKGATLPVPDVAVGRLVETPSEITGMVDDYLALPGGKLPTPHSSLVTGYDFLTSAADAVEGDFSTGLGAGAVNHQLITNQGVPPTTTTGPGGPSRTTSWTAADLSNVLFGSHHDLIFLAGHFSANGALAADYKTSILSTDLAAHPGILKDSLVFSAGCHSGYNLLDGDGVPGVTLGLDWAQAMSQQKATLIAGTGYQYADTDFLAYSAKLYSQLAHQLRSAGTQVAIGQALVNAKQDYLGGLASVSGIDLKAVLESTLYGLPMMGLDLPGRAIPPVPPSGIDTTAAGAGTPGAVLGLRTADLDPILTPLDPPHQKPVLDVNGVATGANFRWLSGSDGTQTAPALPALPQQIKDVTSTNGDVLRGVGFLRGTYTDTTGITPLTGAPTTEQNGIHTTFLSPVFFPQKLWTVNYFDALGGSRTVGRTRVVMTPAQYRLDAGSTTTDTERAYSQMGLRLFYSSNISTYGGNTPALAAPPSISGVSSTVDGSTVHVSAHVTGDPSAGIQQVWVTYTGEQGPFHTHWDSFDLTQNGVDSTLWTGDLVLPGGQSAADVRFVLQAANGVGLVSMDNNQGDGYTPAVSVGSPPSPTATATSLSLDPGPTSGTYLSTVTVGATLTGAPPASLVTFAVGSGVVSAPTDALGHASASLVLQDAPGTYSLTASYAGDPSYLASDATRSGFVIGKAPTTLTLSAVAPTGVGSGIATGLTATLLRSTGAPLVQRTVYFVLVGPTGTRVVPAITDSLGRAALGSLALPIGTQTVTARFLGTVPLPGGAVTLTDTTFLESSATTTLTVSPLEVVRSAQASLKQLTGLTSTQAFTVGLAAVALQGALIVPRWTSGGTRLDKQGDPVLLLINGAVKLLLTVNPKVPAVTAAITSLVGVDRALAQNEIADAVAAHGKAAKITLANAAFASADTAAAQGKTSTAVDLYRTAWLYARDALP